MKTAFVSVLSIACLASALAAQAHRTTAMTWKPEWYPTGGNNAAQDSVKASWGLDWTNAYYFRGIIHENQGIIVQPHLDLTYELTRGDGPMGNLDLVFGTWNSLNDGPSGSGGGPQTVWHESDFYVGLGFSVNEQWSGSASYTVYSSPNGTLATVDEFSAAVHFDDSAMWGEGFGGLKPKAMIAHELKGQADGGGNRGTYGEIGVEPTFELGEVAGLEWTLSVPATIGWSFSEYYEHPVTGGDKNLGFLDIGAVASAPMEFMPARFGPWTMSMSLNALILGNTPEALNNSDALEWILTVGFSTQL